MGSAPGWYPTLVAARWMNVPPWDLAEQPIGWQEAALAAMAAEQHAREMQR